MEYVTVHVKMPRELHTQVKIEAVKNAKTLNDFMVETMAQKVDPKKLASTSPEDNPKPAQKVKKKVVAKPPKSAELKDGKCGHRSDPGMCMVPDCPNYYGTAE